MAVARLINDRGNERDYKISDGRVITLKISEDCTSISFWENDKLLGDEDDFVFRDDGIGNSYLLCRMYIKPKGYGLGRAALLFFKDYMNCTIYTRPNDGNSREDGSELTEDAPGFVYKMVEEKILQSPYSYEMDYCEIDNE